MRKTLFLLLFSAYAFGQIQPKDTVLADGKQPATILKLGKHKIWMAQNKSYQTPYKLQKDGSYISNGVPFVRISLDSKKYAPDSGPSKVEYLYDNAPLEGEDNSGIINIDGVDVFTKTFYDKKKRYIHVIYYYPLRTQFLIISLATNYEPGEDAFDLGRTMGTLVENSLYVFEDFYKIKK